MSNCAQIIKNAFFSCFAFKSTNFKQILKKNAQTCVCTSATIRSSVREVLQEEGRRLRLTIKAVEQGGVSLKRKLTGGDLAAGEQCGQPNCELGRAGLKGCGHRRAGVVYRGTCNICEQNNITATYYVESWFSGYYRTNVHKKEIIDRDLENAFAKHLQIYHPEHEGDPSVFNITVIQTFSKPMPRQCTEAVFIQNSNADIKIPHTGDTNLQ